ncbi:MAG: nitroreductase [Actinocatenispora sp.]
MNPTRRRGPAEETPPSPDSQSSRRAVSGHVPAAALAGALDAAICAPSLHNSQPWHFVVGDGVIQVRLEPRRALPVADPEGNAARIACGAAVYNIRLAMATQLGYDPVVRLAPVRGDCPMLVATVTPGAQRPPTPHERGQYAVIGRRHSNRYPFHDSEPVGPAQRAALTDAARDQRCWLHIVTDPAQATRLTELINEASRALDDDIDYQRELQQWIQPPPDAHSGITPSAAGTKPEPGDRLRTRDYGGRPRRPGRDFEPSPLLAILGGTDDTPVDHVAVGQALQAVLLTATRHGLAVSLFSQPFEVDAVRRQVRALTGRLGSPYLVLRIGYPLRPSPSTPRLPVAEVSDVAD